MIPYVIVTELSSAIAENLAGEFQSLLNLALTCKAFLDPCLDVMWYKQDSLRPLVKTMPQDLWEEQEPEEGFVIEFQRAIYESDLVRFSYYSAKIRDFYLDFSLGVSVEALLSLCSFRPAKMLLPRLLALHVAFRDQLESKHLSVLLSSSIRHLSIACFDFESAEKAFMFGIARLCPNLLSLRLHDPAQSIRFGDSTHQVIQSQFYLRHLEVEFLDVSPEVINHLRSLDVLKSLQQLAISQDSTPAFQSISPADFPELESMGLTPINWGAAATALGRFHSPLTNLTLFSPIHGDNWEFERDPMSPTDIHSIFLGIARFQALTDLHVSGFAPEPYSSEDVENGLSPLFALPKLKKIKLQSPCLSAIRNEWIVTAVANNAFPLVEDFELIPPDLAPEQHPRITLQGLVPLIQHCHLLKKLRVSATCQAFDVTELYNSNPSRIVDIGFHHSPIPDSKGLVRCLICMFPMVERLWGAQRPGFLLRDGDPWGAVYKKWKACL